MKKFIVLLCVGFLFCTSMFAEEIKLSFPKPAEGEASSIYVNGHHIYLCKYTTAVFSCQTLPPNMGRKNSTKIFISSLISIFKCTI